MNERVELLQRALELLAEAAELVHRAAPDEYVRRTVLPELEGRDAGWLGQFAVDILRRYVSELEREAER